MPMMAMTTSNSTRVNPGRGEGPDTGPSFMVALLPGARIRCRARHRTGPYGPLGGDWSPPLRAITSAETSLVLGEAGIPVPCDGCRQPTRGVRLGEIQP